MAQRRARLARRHRLLPGTRTDDVATIADDLVALHSSDPVTVYLSALVRMRHPSVAAVDTALYDDRSVVRHHAMRRTLWVATPSVVRLMHAAATTALVEPERRRTLQLLGANGIEDPQGWLDDARQRVLEVLLEDGPMTARALGLKVPELTHKIQMAPGKSYGASVSAHTRVLLQLGFEGRIVRTRPTGSWVSGAYAYAAMETWMDGLHGSTSDSAREAAGEVADAYLRRFGPVTGIDLQWWAGWTAATTRRALEDAGAEQVQLDDGPGWVAADDATTASAGPWVALLPGLDPTVMGWKERGWYLPAEAADAFDRNGNAGPTIWVDGEVVGAWAQAPDGELRLHFFRDVPTPRRRQVERRRDELSAMIADTRFTVRFPGRVNAMLLGDG
ncbi:MAG: winged helix DNA-binding domain-containing protein [Nocardioidaceae bacterium]